MEKAESQTIDPIGEAIRKLVDLNDINDHISLRVILGRALSRPSASAAVIASWPVERFERQAAGHKFVLMIMPSRSGGLFPRCLRSIDLLESITSELGHDR